MRTIWTLFWLAMAMAMAMVAAVAHADTRAPLTVEAGKPFLRLTLPVSLYSHARTPTLGDIRIENAAGDGVPFAWLHGEVHTPQRATQEVPWFVLPQEADNDGVDGLNLWLQLSPDGTLVLKPTTATARTAATSVATVWIVDASRVQGTLADLHVVLKPEVRGLFPFAIEASDDLRAWRTLVADAQLLSLQQQTNAQERLERLSVPLGGAAARYLRLRWRGAAPEVAALRVDSLQVYQPLSPIEWSAPLRADHCESDHCVYVLPRNTPVDSLQLFLAEPNTLATVRIKGLLPLQQAAQRVYRNPLHALRHKHLHPPPPPLPPTSDRNVQQETLAQAVVYRLSQANGEALSAEIALRGGVYPALRIETDGPIRQLGHEPPQLVTGTLPRTLVFLARGNAPFALRWDAEEKAPGAALPLATLIPGYQDNKPLTLGHAHVTLAAAAHPTWQSTGLAQAPAATKGQPPDAATKAAPDDQRRWLWVVLVAGLALLGGMAYSLFRAMDKK